MSDAMHIALSGLQDASLRVSNAASNIVNSSSTTKDGKKFVGKDVVSTAESESGDPKGVSSKLVDRAEGSEIDMAAEIVAMQTASISYQADAKVLSVVDQTQKKLLDALA